MNKLVSLAALGLAGIHIPALADNYLEEIIVTSSRVEMPLRQVGTSVSVLKELEIQALGFNSLADILRTQPAIGASNTGGAGAPTALRIRGEEGYRTRVYVDGIDISNTSGTQAMPNFEHLASAGIARVEILRGPQGLMYGADAGGIVNISSSNLREGFSGKLSAEGGRFGTRQLAGSAAGGTGSMDFAIAASDFETAGFNARSDDTVLRDDDGYENTTLHGRLGFNAGEHLRLELVARDVDASGDYDNCFTVDTFALSNLCSSDYRQSAWRASAQLDYDHLQHELSYSGNDTERQFYTGGRPAFGGDGELKKWSYVGQYRHGDPLGLVFGAETQEESFDNGGLNRTRDQDSYFLEYQGGFGERFYLTAGLRYDDNEDFGDHDSYRISGAYLIPLTGGELKLKSAWGTGFRAPSLYEVAYNRDFGFSPAADIDLTEETSEGYDLGIAWASDSGLYLEATWFEQRVEDEIFFDLLNYSGYRQNDGASESRGVELAANWELGEGFSLSSNYTWNDTEDAEGLQRIRRPEHLANLGVQWQPLPGRLQLGINLRLARDAVAADGSDLDDYEVLDCNASLLLVGGFSLYGRVENLSDEDYQEVPGYNTGGRALYAGVRYSF